MLAVVPHMRPAGARPMRRVGPRPLRRRRLGMPTTWGSAPPAGELGKLVRDNLGNSSGSTPCLGPACGALSSDRARRPVGATTALPPGALGQARGRPRRAPRPTPPRPPSKPHADRKIGGVGESAPSRQTQPAAPTTAATAVGFRRRQPRDLLLQQHHLPRRGSPPVGPTAHCVRQRAKRRVAPMVG